MATISAETEALKTPRPVGALASYRPHEITLEEFYRMNEAGVFHPRSRTFLFEGRLYEKMPPKRPHVIAADALIDLLKHLMPEGWCAASEQPIEMGEMSQPQPDVSVVRGKPRDYPVRHPTARDVGMLAEVSDASLPDDTGAKLRLYAACGIPVYWVVNIPNRTIDVYARPGGTAAAPGYEVCRSYGPDDAVPVVLDDREVGRIAVRDVLP
jgi:Uma2 family endonuclease